jgi:hypothetical protein
MAHKLVYANTYKFRDEDDPALPFRMDINLRPPDFMNVAFVMLYGGSEEVSFIGSTIEELREVAKDDETGNVEQHLRLRWIRISDRTGKVLFSKDGPNAPWKEGS